MELTGVITNIGELQEVGEKKHPKVEFRVEEVNEKYPNSMVFTLFGEQSIGKIKPFKVGDEVQVSYNSKTTEYNGRVYNNINAWTIKKIKDGDPDKDVDTSSDLPF